MIFDLQGKRRRLVQATYLLLAVLMGGGLVLFGVGSGDISGGLFDAITGKDSNSSGAVNSTVNARIKRDQKVLVINPKNETALATSCARTTSWQRMMPTRTPALSGPRARPS